MKRIRTLYIAEKLSAATDLALALGAKCKTASPYAETPDGDVVTHAVGHMLELMEPGEYDDRWSKWNFDTLPILPPQLKYRPPTDDKRRAEQLKLIGSLLEKLIAWSLPRTPTVPARQSGGTFLIGLASRMRAAFSVFG
jgi:DNA topoisomerase-3